MKPALTLLILLTIFCAFRSRPHLPLTSAGMLAGSTQKSWSLVKMIPDKRCSSAQDDTWTFFADGRFEFNRGSITEDDIARCSDLVNITGNWELLENNSILKVTGQHETGNPTNNFTVTFMKGAIQVLNDDELMVSATETTAGIQYSLQFTKKL